MQFICAAPLTDAGDPIARGTYLSKFLINPKANVDLLLTEEAWECEEARGEDVHISLPYRVIFGAHRKMCTSSFAAARNLLSAVTTLARQCGNLRALSRGYWSAGPNTPPHHYCIPFDPRSHSPLFHHSFSTITDLSLCNIPYRSDTDFLAFIFSFSALEKLSLSCVHCKTSRRIKEEDYILLLKQRKRILGKLRCLTMVCRPNSRAVIPN